MAREPRIYGSVVDIEAASNLYLCWSWIFKNIIPFKHTVQKYSQTMMINVKEIIFEWFLEPDI